MVAGIEHADDDLVDRPLENPLPYIQEPGMLMWVGEEAPGGSCVPDPSGQHRILLKSNGSWFVDAEKLGEWRAKECLTSKWLVSQPHSDLSRSSRRVPSWACRYRPCPHQVNHLAGWCPFTPQTWLLQ